MREWKWLAALLVAASAHAAPVGSIAVFDRSVARVGDAVIWESEVTARLANRDPSERGAVIDMLIDDELMLAEARRAQVTTDDAEVKAAIEEIKKQNNLDDAGLDAALKQQGYTRARYLVDLARQIVILRVKNQLVRPRVLVEDADVEAEMKKRNAPSTEKESVRRELTNRAYDVEIEKWLVDLRRRAWIERRP